MKRIGKSLAALALALVMSLTLLPVQAMAAEGDLTGKGGLKTVYTGEYINPLYADALGAETSGWSQPKVSIQRAADVQTVADEPYLTEAEAVKELQRRMIAREESITINVQVPSGADLQKKMDAWWQDALAHTSKNGSAGDYLRWQYAGYSSSASTSNGSDWKVTYAAPKGMTSIWYTDAAQEKNLTSYIQSTILPQLALNGKTTYQKVQAIYDWITRNVRYDKKNLDDNSYYLKYTAFAAAINKTAVCQGYTNLFYRLANDAGIDCRIITGGKHAWNIVQMDDGKYYCMDATWNEGQSSYSYFLKGLPEFSKTHSPQTDSQNTPYWTAYESKMSNTDYNAAPVPTPTRPANVTLVSAKAVSGGIQVTWKEAAGAATYKVYRKDAANPDWTALTTTATGTSYVDKTAVAGVTYTYTVRGVAKDGKTLSPSHDKTGVSATMPKPISRPANVTLVSAKAVSGGIQVTWKEAAGAATYKVYRKDAANPDWTALTTTATGTSYVDKTAEPGVTYTYTVRGVASDGKTLSPSHEPGVSATSRPANVTLVSAKAVSGGIQVTWKEAAGAATYKVYRKDATNTSWTALTTTATGTSYVDKTAKAGVKYTYTVRGVAEDGKTLSPSHDKTGVSATMPKPISRPANVTLVSAKAVSGGIQVTWKEAAGAATYKVYRKDAANPDWTALTTTATGTSYVDKTAKAGVTYTYTVRGVAKDGKTLSPSHDKTGVSATMPKPSRPANVTLVSAKAVSGGIQVTWKEAAGAATYKVYRKDAANPDWTALTTTATGTSYVDKTAKAGVKYTYTVRGVAKDGKTLSPSHDKTGVSATMPKPSRPANVTLVSAKAVTSGGIQVTWKEAAGAATYKVYRKDAANPDWTGLTTTATGTSYVDKSAVAGVTYTYTVRGVAEDGKTLSPSHDKTGVSATARPANVTLVSAKAVSGGIQVTWKEAAGAATYKVYRKDATNPDWTALTTTATGTSYVDKTAKAGVKYTYTVRGVAKDGKTLSPSHDKTGVSATATPARVALVDAKRITTGTKGIQVRWKSAANAQTYNVYRAANPPTDRKGNPAAVTSGWKLVGKQVNGLSFKDTTGQPGVTYAYTVRGVAADGKTRSATYNEYGVRATMPKR